MEGDVASDPAEISLRRRDDDLARPSAIDRVFLAVERLPGPPELFYAAVGVGIAVVAQAVLWASGVYAFGIIDVEVVQGPLLAAFLLALTHLLTRVARSAFEQFRPALGDAPDVELYRRQLTSVPDRTGVVSMVVGALFVFVGYYAFVVPYVAGRPLIVDLISAPLWIVTAAVGGLFVAYEIRQLRTISRLSRTAPNVDIFKPTPINAFARLTSVSAVAILLMVTVLTIGEEEIPTAYVVLVVGMAALAIAVFVLPLRAMHARLETEKSRLQSSAQDRLKLVLARIHDAVERDDTSRADELQKMLASVLAERELLDKLHTWPWSTTTFRGVASALLLPVMIFVITRVIERAL